ncbi:hypothetical protein ABTF76_21545, partial [Acinetobacter baumannii]
MSRIRDSRFVAVAFFISNPGVISGAYKPYSGSIGQGLTALSDFEEIKSLLHPAPDIQFHQDVVILEQATDARRITFSF